MTKTVFIGLILFVIGCTAPKTSSNSTIDTQVKEKIDSLNKRIIGAIHKGELSSVEYIFSENFLKGDIARMKASLLNLKDAFKWTSFVVDDEFHIAQNRGKANSLSGDIKGEKYNYTFSGLGESYVVIGHFKLEKPNDDIYVNFTYNKVGNDWKLFIFHLGNISRHYKTAFQWYTESKTDYKNGALVDAALKLQIAFVLLRPFNDYLQFERENEFLQFQSTVEEKITREVQFPLEIKGMNSSAKVFSVSFEIINTGYIPVVSYVSTIDLNDRDEIEKENAQIHANIEATIAGIRQNKDIAYRVYNQLPNAVVNPPYIGLVPSSN